MSVTIQDLKGEIKEYNYKTLTGGDDDLAQRALDKAVIWAKAKIVAACGTFDENDEINKLVVIKRALYELYSAAENEGVAQDKKQDAHELLVAKYGNAVDSAGYAGSTEQRTPIATGAVVRGK